MRLGLYARVSTHEQQTLALQRDAMTAYAQQRRGSIVLTVEDIGTDGPGAGRNAGGLCRV
jgi:DNA invertase Pin-like site-specific DNA recombinase